MKKILTFTNITVVKTTRDVCTTSENKEGTLESNNSKAPMVKWRDFESRGQIIQELNSQQHIGTK